MLVSFGLLKESEDEYEDEDEDEDESDEEEAMEGSDGEQV